jgi:chromosome partitioning protein
MDPMNPVEWFNFFKEILQKDAEVIASFAMGVMFAGVIVASVGLWRWFLRSAERKDAASLRVEIAELKSKNADSERERHGEQGRAVWLQSALDESATKLRHEEQAHRDDVKAANDRVTLADGEVESAIKQVGALNGQIDLQRGKIQELSKECERLKEEYSTLLPKNSQLQREAADLQSRLQEANQVAGAFKQQVDDLAEQVRRVEQLQGKLWEKPVGLSVPRFRPLVRGKPPVLAVANLKGGVGKTSLTANLAATAAARGQRVLVVDLDYQASLTQLCLPLERIQDLRHAGSRFVQDVFKATSEHGTIAWRNSVRVEHQSDGADGSMRILATDEDLADVEEHVKARWLLSADSMDVRYLLRAAFHDPVIQDRFDLILLDCPPRLSTACINALACCDWVLIPVLLDRVSTEAVPRLLVWLRHLKMQGLCPDMAILGVLANRTQQRPRLTPKETGVWEDLKAKSEAAWRGAVYLFDRFIPSSQAIADAAGKPAFAAHHSSLESLFIDLAEEFQRRLTTHESSRRTAVR